MKSCGVVTRARVCVCARGYCSGLIWLKFEINPVTMRGLMTPLRQECRFFVRPLVEAPKVCMVFPSSCTVATTDLLELCTLPRALLHSRGDLYPRNHKKRRTDTLLGRACGPAQQDYYCDDAAVPEVQVRRCRCGMCRVRSKNNNILPLSHKSERLWWERPTKVSDVFGDIVFEILSGC